MVLHLWHQGSVNLYDSTALQVIGGFLMASSMTGKSYRSNQCLLEARSHLVEVDPDVYLASFLKGFAFRCYVFRKTFYTGYIACYIF